MNYMYLNINVFNSKFVGNDKRILIRILCEDF